jgi:heme-degrading monooxygenase HmoA
MLALIFSYCKAKVCHNLGPVALSLLLATVVLHAGACGNDDDDASGGSATSETPDDGCARGTLEADLSNYQGQTTYEGEALAGQTKLVGPGVDAAGKLKPGSYVFSSTYLRMPTDRSALGRFLELSAPMLESLPTLPGLVAFSFSSGPSCTTLRTLTVWENEEAMFAFAASASHRAAVAATSEVSRGGSAVTHWSGTETDGTWTKSAAELTEVSPLD